MLCQVRNIAEQSSLSLWRCAFQEYNTCHLVEQLALNYARFDMYGIFRMLLSPPGAPLWTPAARARLVTAPSCPFSGELPSADGRYFALEVKPQHAARAAHSQ